MEQQLYIPLTLLHMTCGDVADYMNELCDDLEFGCITQEQFDTESNVIENSYPFFYYQWLR